MIRASSSFALGVAIALSAPSLLAQQEIEDHKFQIGLRAGYAFPIGRLTKDEPIQNVVKSMIPIWLDVGYKLTPNFLVGLYAQYGFVTAGSDLKAVCDELNTSCSGNDIRFGLEGQYLFLPGKFVDPWLGLGAGYEILNSKTAVASSSGPQPGSISYRGLEFFNVQGGADFALGDRFSLGPFVSFSFGQFSKTTGDTPASIDNKAFHAWLLLGVKGSFGI